MRKLMNAVETGIYSGPLWGKMLRYATDPDNGGIYYYGKDVSKALKGLTLQTQNLKIGQVKFFKGTDWKNRQINAGKFLDVEAIMEVVSNLSSDYVAKNLHDVPFYQGLIEDAQQLKLFATRAPQPVAAPAKTMGKEPTLLDRATEQMSQLESRVRELEQQIRSYKTKELTQQIDETNIAVADFNKKWSVAYSMIEEYMTPRMSIFVNKMDQIEYRRSVWNNFIMVEVDSKLGTNLRSRHINTATPYKDLIRNAGVIDEFFGIVSSLLKFGKG
jgi:hypothetical protein